MAPGVNNAHYGRLALVSYDVNPVGILTKHNKDKEIYCDLRGFANSRPAARGPAARFASRSPVKNFGQRYFAAHVLICVPLTVPFQNGRR